MGRRDRERGARLGDDDVDLIPRRVRRSAAENEKALETEGFEGF